jgi:hypothetical protein
MTLAKSHSSTNGTLHFVVSLFQAKLATRTILEKAKCSPYPRSLNITYPISTITTTKKSPKQVFHLPRQISAEPVTRTLNADQSTFARQSGASQD